MNPAGYRVAQDAPGVTLYRNRHNYVQVVKLDRGAFLSLVHGGIKIPRIGQGVFGGDDPKVKFHPLRVYWRYLRQNWYDARLFSVVNGMFWKVADGNPARLTLPVRINGRMITDGFDTLSYIKRGKTLMLELYESHAVIRELKSGDDIYTSEAASIICGLNGQAARAKMSRIGRTMIGVDEPGSTLFIFSSKAALQNEGYAVLKRAFHADRVMMLDGGGSSQMICRGVGYVASSRAVPQVVAVVSGQ